MFNVHNKGHMAWIVSDSIRLKNIYLCEKECKCFVCVVRENDCVYSWMECETLNSKQNGK